MMPPSNTPAGQPLGIAFVGCGYVADSYRHCLDLHADGLRLAGVFDRDPARLQAFRQTWNCHAYGSLAELLADPQVGLVVNLTNPASHAEVTRAAIGAGHHVYSEKPLGMTASEARGLADSAASRGVRLAAAPSNVLGEQAQTLWKAVRQRRIGDVRLIYAELDDGMIHKARHADWASKSGRAWPAEEEFETGCTFEHAGYTVTLLVAMFGPVRRVTAFSRLIIADKGRGQAPARYAPDFSCGCLEFDDGVVARVTNSIVAPYNHALRLVGEDGVLDVAEPWDFASPVRQKSTSTTRLGRLLERRFGGGRGSVVPTVRPVPFRGGRGKPTMDFMRGVRECADALRENRACRLSPELAVHITEVTEMLQHPDRFPSPARVTSTVSPMVPMVWAQ